MYFKNVIFVAKMCKYGIFVAKIGKYGIFVAKIGKYGIFVVKIYKYALIDRFQGSPGSLDSAANCAALQLSTIGMGWDGIYCGYWCLSPQHRLKNYFHFLESLHLFPNQHVFS